MPELEKELFRYLRADQKKLEQYGFEKKEGLYKLEKLFFHYAFLASLLVDENGRLTGTVYDRETGDPFVQLYVPGQKGEYVGSVLEEYLGFLREVAENCFEQVCFCSPQANLALDELRRFLDSEKVSHRSKNTTVVFSRGSQSVQIREDEVSPGLFQAVLLAGEKHGLPKQIPLDGSLTNQQISNKIFRVLDSLGLTGHRAWVIPAKPHYFDVVAAFERQDTLTWHQSASVRAGDDVYIYYGAPYSCILFQCEVTECNVPVQYGKYTKGMTLKKKRRFFPDAFSRDWLKEEGLNNVRNTRTVPPRTLAAMQEKIEEGGCVERSFDDAGN